MKAFLFFGVAAAVTLAGCASEQITTKPSAILEASCKPGYPAEAKRSETQGRVVVRVKVEPSGKVSEVELDRTSGSSLLDRAAMEAAKCTRYKPGVIGGAPGAMWTEFVVNYVP